MGIAAWLVVASTSALFAVLAYLSSWVVESDIEVPDYPHQIFRLDDVK